MNTNKPTKPPIEYLSEIGSKGGQATSEAKAIAARLNGLSGGRPPVIYIYGMMNLETGRVEYVGQTSNPKRRNSNHKTYLGKRGELPFGMVILCQTDVEHANECERSFWEHYKQHGECTMNGDKYVDFWLRTPEWVKYAAENYPDSRPIARKRERRPGPYNPSKEGSPNNVKG